MSSRDLLALLLVGCVGGAEVPDPVELPTTPLPDPCAIPLAASVDRAGVLAHGGTTVRAQGGSGEVAFAMADAPSGGLVSPRTGAYVAGATSGVTDRIAITDAGCGQEAEVAVAVVPPMAVRPTSARVPPDTSFTIEATGGSGDVACALVQDGSAASLQGCTWAAGPRTGTDRIEVVDAVTGQRIEVAYQVEPATLELYGGRLYLPLDEPFTPRWTAGTGAVDLQDAPGVVSVDGRLVGVVPGAYRVTATDHFAPALQTTFDVEVIAPRGVSAVRDGERAYWADVRGGDIDGDGFADAVVASVEPSVGAHFSGAVYVYAGGPSGLDPEPVVVLSVPQQYAYAGRGVDLGDLDGDGRLDLAVGAPGWDEDRRTDRGRVDVYLGQSGGFFATEPDHTLLGEVSGDNLGHGVAICDVDGDGVDDLAASVPFGEDRGDDPIRYSEGGILVWRGSPNGLVASPTWRVYSGTRDHNLGRTLAAGDVDADGRCDLLGGSYADNLDGAGSDGVAWLFRSSTVLAGGSADRRYTSDLDDGQIEAGRAMTLGDLDGDGRDDVVLGAWVADGATGGSEGAVWVFAEADAPPGPDWPTSQATAALHGNGSGDYFGTDVDVADGGLWVGAGNDEVPGGTGGVGVVWRYGSGVLHGDVPTIAAAGAVAGLDPGSFFGTGLAVVGDTDGDGQDDLVVVAPRDDASGVESGAAYLVGTAPVPVALHMPGEPAGAHLGARSSVGWQDVGGGRPDLVAGAWGVPYGSSYNGGAAFRWAADPGWPLDASQVYAGFDGQAAGDRYGAGVAGAGDFDGDGTEDLVVVARDEDRPASFPADYADPDRCPGDADTTGAAWVLSGRATEPSFVVYGEVRRDRLDVVAGGFDHDGDGFDDVVLGSTFAAGDVGGFTLARGRAASPAGVTVICEARTVLGVSAYSRLGSAVAGVGDLDGDGCDEVAVGADADDLGRSNQGSVRIWWGHGPACASAAPEVTTLVSDASGDRLGSAVAGGLDVDRDGVPDVVVAGFGADGAVSDTGAIWLASGAWIAGLSRQPGDPLPADGATVAHGLPSAGRRAGTVQDGDFGSDLALVPDPTDGRSALVAVGHRRGDEGGVPRSGGVVVLRWADAGAWEAEPVAIVAGETRAPGGELGAGLRAHPGAPVLAVGAPLSDALGLDGGAVYPIELR